MKKHSIKVLLFLLFFSTSKFTISQYKNPGSSIPTPNSASLGVYNEMPVSYFTGVPNISIPLYEIEGNNISLPVSISYHAGGIRPEIHPGWVGNGWSLIAGGQITRITNGQSDERRRPGQGKTGYFFNYANLNNPNWSSEQMMRGPGGTYPILLPEGNSVFMDADTEPDEFDFSFCGYSGKFFLDQTGNWQVQSDNILKVSFDNNEFVLPFTTRLNGYDASKISPTFGRFTITDNKGNRYIFGSLDNNNSAIEFSDVMRFTQDGIGATIEAKTWYLSKIISPDGLEEINLNYERGPLVSQLNYSSSWGGFQSPGVGTNTWGYIPANFTSACTNPINSCSISGTVLFPVYLKSISMASKGVLIDFSRKNRSNDLKYVDDISAQNEDYTKTLLYIYKDQNGIYQWGNYPVSSEFPSKYVQDAYEMGVKDIVPYYKNNPSEVHTGLGVHSTNFIWLKLNGIDVYNTRNNSKIKSFNFIFDEQQTKRLQLQRLEITERQTNIFNIKKYKFGYNNDVTFPKYLSSLGDHWGFYNGQQIPNDFRSIDYQSDFYDRRKPDETGISTQAEILTSIIYPTGGKATFEYEANTYSGVIYRDAQNMYVNGTNPKPETGIGGGVRVKKITTIDQYGNSMERNFYYVKNYYLNANISNLPSSGILDAKPKYQFNNTGIIIDNGQQLSYGLISSGSVIPTTSNSAGTLVGYSQVVEKKPDGSYTLYEFSNHDNGYTDQLPFSCVYSLGMNAYPPTSFAFKRGKLIHKTEFAVINNEQKIISEIITNYSTNLNENGLVTANALYNRPTFLCDNEWEVMRSAYYLKSSKFLPTRTEENLYSSDGSGRKTTKITNLLYDGYNNLATQTAYNSKGQEVITTYRYPYSFSNVNNSLNPYSMLVSQNNISVPIEKRVIIDGKVVSGEIYTYRVTGVNKVYNDAIYKLDVSEPVIEGTLQQTSADDAGVLSFDSRYTKSIDLNYDASGNITTVITPGSDASSYIWDYIQGVPTAKISNANNIHAVTPVSGTSFTDTKTVQLSGTMYSTYNGTFFVNQNGGNGFINLSFEYNNKYISGNNSSILSYTITGVTNPNYSQSGSLCAATMWASCNSGSSTASISNLPPGQYNIYAILISVTGFSNYYGYFFKITYPTQFQTPSSQANSEVAYTSFEYSNNEELNFGTGNFTGVSLSNIQSGISVTGDSYYSLTPGGQITKTGLNSSKVYIVSYWSNSGALSVTGTQPPVNQISELSFGGWKYYEHKVTGVSAVVISGNAGIDELRLYPDGALMETYTYRNLIGMTSRCDINNKVTYYEYDNYNRLETIRDRDKNIIKTFEYKY